MRMQLFQKETVIACISTFFPFSLAALVALPVPGFLASAYEQPPSPNTQKTNQLNIQMSAGSCISAS